MDCFTPLEDKSAHLHTLSNRCSGGCSRFSADVRSSDDVIAIKVDAVDPEFHTSLKWILDNSIVRSCTRRLCHAEFEGA